MVTGSALCLQGIALANQSRVLDPIELRSLLHDTGTPQAGTRLIGPRPDLGAAVDALLNSASVPESGSLARLPLVAAPNPFHERSEVRFSLSEATNGTLTVFDAQGRAVRLLQNGSFAAGPQVVGWDGRDDDGTRVASGVYYYRFQTDGSTDRLRSASCADPALIAAAGVSVKERGLPASRMISA
ncbi:MAG: FlgD immunoglobulin-like domain containing protein [Candidatus Eisenbacteria bacterium]